MKINSYILSLLIFSSLFLQAEDFVIKDFVENGKIDALIENQDERLYLVQLDMKTDSLVERALSVFPNLQLYGGRASYHRLMSENHYVVLRESFSKSNYRIIDYRWTFNNGNTERGVIFNAIDGDLTSDSINSDDFFN